MQTFFHGLHGFFGQANPFFVGAIKEFDKRLDALPSHAACPAQHCLHINQLRTIPVLLQNTPATLNRVVFAVVWRVVQELDGLANMVGKFHHTLEKLGALSAVLGAGKTSGANPCPLNCLSASLAVNLV